MFLFVQQLHYYKMCQLTSLTYTVCANHLFLYFSTLCHSKTSCCFGLILDPQNGSKPTQKTIQHISDNLTNAHLYLWMAGLLNLLILLSPTHHRKHQETCQSFHLKFSSLLYPVEEDKLLDEYTPFHHGRHHNNQTINQST